MNPDVPNVVTEYGSTIARRPGNLNQGGAICSRRNSRGEVEKLSGAHSIMAPVQEISVLWE